MNSITEVFSALAESIGTGILLCLSSVSLIGAVITVSFICLYYFWIQHRFGKERLDVLKKIYTREDKTWIRKYWFYNLLADKFWYPNRVSSFFIFLFAILFVGLSSSLNFIASEEFIKSFRETKLIADVFPILLAIYGSVLIFTLGLEAKNHSTIGLSRAKLVMRTSYIYPLVYLWFVSAILSQFTVVFSSIELPIMILHFSQYLLTAVCLIRICSFYVFPNSERKSGFDLLHSYTYEAIGHYEHSDMIGLKIKKWVETAMGPIQLSTDYVSPSKADQFTVELRIKGYPMAFHKRHLKSHLKKILKVLEQIKKKEVVQHVKIQLPWSLVKSAETNCSYVKVYLSGYNIPNGPVIKERDEIEKMLQTGISRIFKNSITVQLNEPIISIKSALQVITSIFVESVGLSNRIVAMDALDSLEKYYDWYRSILSNEEETPLRRHVGHIDSEFVNSLQQMLLAVYNIDHSCDLYTEISRFLSRLYKHSFKEGNSYLINSFRGLLESYFFNNKTSEEEDMLISSVVQVVKFSSKDDSYSRHLYESTLALFTNLLKYSIDNNRFKDFERIVDFVLYERNWDGYEGDEYSLQSKSVNIRVVYSYGVLSYIWDKYRGDLDDSNLKQFWIILFGKLKEKLSFTDFILLYKRFILDKPAIFNLFCIQISDSMEAHEVDYSHYAELSIMLILGKDNGQYTLSLPYDEYWNYRLCSGGSLHKVLKSLEAGNRHYLKAVDSRPFYDRIPRLENKFEKYCMWFKDMELTKATSILFLAERVGIFTSKFLTEFTGGSHDYYDGFEVKTKTSPNEPGEGAKSSGINYLHDRRDFTELNPETLLETTAVHLGTEICRSFNHNYMREYVQHADFLSKTEEHMDQIQYCIDKLIADGSNVSKLKIFYNSGLYKTLRKHQNIEVANVTSFADASFIYTTKLNGTVVQVPMYSLRFNKGEEGSLFVCDSEKLPSIINYATPKYVNEQFNSLNIGNDQSFLIRVVDLEDEKNKVYKESLNLNKEPVAKVHLVIWKWFSIDFDDNKKYGYKFTL